MCLSEMEQQHPMLQREITFAELFPNGTVHTYSHVPSDVAAGPHYTFVT